MEVGKSAQFTCEPTGTGKPVWYHTREPELPVDITPIYKGKVLSLRLVQLKFAGYYYCYGFKLLSRKHFWAQTRLKVYG